ncbi:MAG: hypothetical protein RRX93_05410 [Bacteroidales bacterium]
MKTNFKLGLITTALMLLFSIPSSLFAQNKTVDQSSKILTKEQQDSIIWAFPKQVDGMVYFKDQSKGNVPAKLNYNYYSQITTFENPKPTNEEDSILKLDNVNEVFMIVMGPKTFIPIGSTLGELLVDDVVCLVDSKKVNVTEAKTGAYGTGGSTSSISNVQSIDGNAGSRSGGGKGMDGSNGSSTSFSGANYSASANQYNFSANVKFMISNYFFLMKDMKLYPLTRKNLKKNFPHIEDFIEQYITDNKPDFSNKEDMVTFISLCNGRENEAKHSAK